MYIINDGLGTYGGSTTLLLRIAQWSAKNNESIKIYTPSADNKEIVSKLEKFGVYIDVFDVDNSSELMKHILVDIQDKRCTFISFTLMNFMNIELIKAKMKKKFVNTLYAIHPDTYIRGSGYSNKVIRGIIKTKYKSLLLKLYRRGILMSMDKDIVARTEEYYDINLSSMHVQLLPMICEEIQKENLDYKIKNSFESKTIVTACRADFPFKGYIFGLIDDFCILANKYPKLKLEIVCSGDAESVNLLVEKLKSIKSVFQERIVLHKWMDYEKLKELTSKCYLSIGMGTAIVDAAVLYVPSIAVKYNTYENIGDYIFCERPEYLVAYEGKAISVIDRLLSMRFEQYYQISKECFEMVKKHYNIDCFFEYIESLTEDMSNIRFPDILFHILNRYSYLKNRGDDYSVEKIERED